jgi:uncharacterized protein YggE
MRALIVPAVLWVLTSPAAAQTAAPPQPPSLIVSGEAVVKRAPDRAWVTVTAESRARNPRDAQKQNAELMKGVMQKLAGAGFSGDAVQTRGYDLQPEYDYNNGRQTLRGYVARNSVEVRIDDIARVGEVLDVAVASGATSVGNVRFDLKDRGAAEREALRLAVENARLRADALAAGGGLKIERIVRIEEHRAHVDPPRPMATFRAGAAAESLAAEPPIEAGELEVRAAVTVVVTVR